MVWNGWCKIIPKFWWVSENNVLESVLSYLFLRTVELHSWSCAAKKKNGVCVSLVLCSATVLCTVLSQDMQIFPANTKTDSELNYTRKHLKQFKQSHKRLSLFILVSRVQLRKCSSFIEREEKQGGNKKKEREDFFALQKASCASWLCQLYTSFENWPSQS